MTPRRIKIIAVIFGLICLGMFSTLSLRCYLISRYHASRGDEAAGAQVEIVADGIQGEDSLTSSPETEDNSLPNEMEPGGAVAGAAQVLTPEEAGTEGKNESRQGGTQEEDLAKRETASDEETDTFVVIETEEVSVSLSGGDREEWADSSFSSQETYIKYLGEIAVEVEMIYAKAEGASAAETQEAENYAYRLWDDELNRIYPVLRDSLSDEEAEELKMEERQWIKDRDAKAQKDSASATSETGRQLAYTRSLTETTRERTYELAFRYFSAQDQP